MTPSIASRTALATALMRALHSRTAPAPLIDDPWGERLVPEPARQALPEAMLRANPAFADVILRSRYAEDALQAALARGVDQYVLIGAGFDSYACRRPPGASQLAVYEVDHPATQELKRRSLQERAVSGTGPLHFVPADLSSEDLGTALARSPFRRERPAFLSWLGVSVYLGREANLATLRAVAASTAPGSELVFSYVDEIVFRPGHADPAFLALRQQVSSLGEGFQSGFAPATLASQLRELGFDLLEDLDGEQLLARYDPADVNGLTTSAAAHIAHARRR